MPNLKPPQTESSNQPTVGSSSIWSPRKFSLRQYAFVLVGLLALAGGILIFASSSINTPVNSNNTIIGLNNASKMGASVAKTITNGGVKWTRIEDGADPVDTVANADAEGLKTDIIVGNDSNSTPLDQINLASWVSETVAEVSDRASDPNVGLYEVMNEPVAKGNGNEGDPVTYGKMYLALYNTLIADNIHVKLLFADTGDYKKACTNGCSGGYTWSQDANGGGWMRDAVNANPGLAQAILANGVTTHVYGDGSPTENDADDTGIAAVAAEENVAKTVLGAIPDFYITETGFSIGAGSPSVPDQATQASLLNAQYTAYLADPHIKGIWVYTIDDDGSGNFGVFNSDGSPRPAFTEVMVPVASSGSSGGGGGGGDTTPPTVSVTAPASGATVSGTQTVTANASDNVGVTGVQFELDGKALGSVDTTSPYSVSWNTTIASNGSHSLTAVASDAAGNTATATTINVTVSNKDTTPPSTPTGLSATAPTSAQVALKWNASTDNVGVTSYKIYRNGSTTALATVNAPTTSYADSAVSASTQYSYTVTALDAAGNESGHSAVATVTTPAATDKTPPSIPTNLHSTATTTNSISLAWNASTDNTGGSGLAGYHLYRGGVLIASPTTNSFTDTGLTASTSYTYSVSAYDNAANGSASSSPVTVSTQSSADTQPPSTPTGLSATAPTSAAVDLSWNASTDNVGVTSYKVYRVTGTSWGNGTTTALTTINAPAGSPVTYTDSAVSAGSSYTYEVTALDAAGNQSGHSTATSATTPAATDKTPPSVPTNVHSTATTTTSISLAWTASTDTGGSGLAGYHVYRSGNLIASPTTNSYTDPNLSPGTAYTYSVSAYDNAANGSAASSPVTVSTQSGTPTTMVQNFKWNASTESLSWTAYSGAYGYNIATISNPTSTRNTTYTYPPVTGTGYSPTPLPGQTVNYGIIPVTQGSGGLYPDEAGANWLTPEVTVTWSAGSSSGPTTPTNLHSTSVGKTTIALAWNASSESGGTIAGYHLYRNGTLIASPTSTAYTDSNLTASTTYVYTVTAFDKAGNVSAAAKSLSVKTQSGHHWWQF